MKTLRSIFRLEETKKSIGNFSGNIDFNSMLTVRGGQDEDLWAPPIPVTPPPPPKN
ncbi:MAG: hypothetical protein JEY96_08980 [Bacteroidales bacterium]|nr:hypothetical protein [Bacteroidales bacterium]